MTEEGRQEDEDREPGAEGADELPPPSTWAGRARQERERPREDEGASGMTEEFESLETELGDDLEISAADEEEEAPDEFAFEDDDEDEDEDDEDEDGLEAEGEIAAEGDTPDESHHEPDAEPEARLTVEADTLALADIEEAREAAHAGLAARARKSSFSQEVTTSSHKVQRSKPPERSEPPPPAPEADESGVGPPPKRRMGMRFVAAAVVIVSSIAAATAVSSLLFLSDIAKGLNDENLSSARSQLATVEGGDPQTILILGSDKRSGTEGDPGRSDTAMLLRVDPDKPFLSLMSLPRDLTVPIPGYGPGKLNEAYTQGELRKPGDGPSLAIETIKNYLDIDINHVVNVDFEGFYEAVNAIDCVYIDVDRRYFNSNEGLFGDQLYAEIDVPAGYSKLCGYRALQYVRYRHEDNDLVRGARQQDFIREARQRIPPSDLLPVFGRANEFIDIFTKNTSSDINSASTILEMMKSFAAVREAPVRQVSLGEIQDDGSVVATEAQREAAVDQFLGNDLDDAADEPADEPAPKPEDKKDPPKEPSEPQGPALVDVAGASQGVATRFEKFFKDKKVDLPVFYPTQIVQTVNTRIDAEQSNSAALAGPNDKVVYHQFKFVIPYQEEGSYGAFTSYYGLSGTNWKDPPILKNPSGYRTIDGREYMLFYERERLRLVAWQTSKGSYWVNNTLTHALDEDEMLAVATSTRELGQ